jgi:hypothetical protein
MIEHKDIVIHKYEVVDGIATLPNTFFFKLLQQIMEEGAENTFYLLAQPDTLDAFQFTHWCQSNNFYFVMYKGEPFGFTVVTEIRTGFGFIDIYVFKKHWGTDAADAGRMQATEWLLTNEWLSLLAFIPMNNEHMVRSLHKVKWKDLGILPKSRIDKKNNVLVDQLVGYGSREMYEVR